MDVDVLHLVLTAGEADKRFKQPVGTTRQNLNKKRLEGRRSAGTWLVRFDDCVMLYKPESADQIRFENVSDQNENVSVQNENVFDQNENVSVNNVAVLRTGVAGRRKNVHILRDGGLMPFCGQAEVDNSTVAIRQADEVTCKLCMKFHK